MKSSISSLSSDTRRILGQLRGEDLVSPHILADKLNTYVQSIACNTHSEFFDLQTADRVADLCRRLLESLPANPSDRQHRLTQLAISYFVLEEDVEDDNDSLIGFDDDLQVVVAVIEDLGLHDLLDAGSTNG